MKKINGLLVLASLLLISGCEKGPDNATLVEEAKTFYYQSIKSTEKTAADYELASSIIVAGQEYEISWELKLPEGAIEGVVALASEKNENGKYLVSIVQEKSVDVDSKYTLVGTLKSASGETSSFELNRYVPLVKSGNPEVVTEIQVGVAYKFGLVQEKLEKNLFLNGQMSGNYVATYDHYILGSWVYLENSEVTGEYYAYTTVDDKKLYFNCYTYDSKGTTKVSQSLSETDKSSWKWNSDLNTITTYVEATQKEYYWGTYNTYNTISASDVSYAATSFVGQFYKMPALKVNAVDAPEVGVAYKFYCEQEKVGKTLYLTGEMSGNYLASTDMAGAAADVYVEAGEVADTYYLYTNVGGVKKYVNITTYYDTKKETTKNSQSLSETDHTAYTWNADLKTLVAHIDELNADFYLGTYNTYTTLSSSNTSYASTSYVCHLGVVETRDPVILDSFVEGVPYKFGCYQEKVGTNLYLTGEMSGNYLASTSNGAEACNVYVEKGEVDGTYYLYTMVGEDKTYINITTYYDSKKETNKNSQGLSTTEKTAYTYNEELNTFVAHIDLLNGDFYLGTYNTYTTLSSSNTSYAATSYVCHLQLVYED